MSFLNSHCSNTVSFSFSVTYSSVAECLLILLCVKIYLNTGKRTRTRYIQGEFVWTLLFLFGFFFCFLNTLVQCCAID